MTHQKPVRSLVLGTLMVMLASCAAPAAQVPAPTVQPAAAATATATRTPRPTATPTAPWIVPETPVAVPSDALLFRQDFESGAPESASASITKWFAQWHVTSDGAGGNAYCNDEASGFSYFFFGDAAWKDYAVELRVKALKAFDGNISLMSRFDEPTALGYRASWNPANHLSGLRFASMYKAAGSKSVPIDVVGVWHTWRLETFGETIQFLIDNQPVTRIYGKQQARGRAGFALDPRQTVCVDDIRAWGLTTDGNLDPAQAAGRPALTKLDAFAQIDVYPQVWSFNSPTSQTWEYKTWCGIDPAPGSTCFLTDVDDVVVTTPGGEHFPLHYDFGADPYSGNMRQRWVLYGPDGGGLPPSGTYTFTYRKHGEVQLVQQYDYPLAVVPYATNVKLEQAGNDLHVTWDPPADLPQDMSYKVIISRGDYMISQVFDRSSSEALLPNLPLERGQKYELVVMIGAVNRGFSNSERLEFTWH